MKLFRFFTLFALCLCLAAALTVTAAADAAEVDWSALTHEEVADAIALLHADPAIERVELGEEREGGPSWADIRALEEAAPQAEFSYRFRLWKREFSLQDEELDLNHLHVREEGVPLVREVIACMPHLRWLCMDSCKVSNETMAALRDEFPEIEVVWRVSFGKAYSVRTDVEKILASNPGVGGNLTSEELNETLIYCTKLRYLDLGHNWEIRDLSFLSYMPELEVLILAINHVSDLSPLADCPKLEYLELFMTDIEDLSPLSELHELRHLNIGMCEKLADMTPLYGLELERLYIGTKTQIPPEQMEEYARLHPDCEMDTTHEDTSIGAWRFTTAWDEDEEYKAQDYYLAGCAPRYALLRVQFGYHGEASDYSYSWKDPNY